MPCFTYIHTIKTIKTVRVCVSVPWHKKSWQVSHLCLWPVGKKWREWWWGVPWDGGFPLSKWLGHEVAWELHLAMTACWHDFTHCSYTWHRNHHSQSTVSCWNLTRSYEYQVIPSVSSKHWRGWYKPCTAHSCKKSNFRQGAIRQVENPHEDISMPEVPLDEERVWKCPGPPMGLIPSYCRHAAIGPSPWPHHESARKCMIPDTATLAESKFLNSLRALGLGATISHDNW